MSNKRAAYRALNRPATASAATVLGDGWAWITDDTPTGDRLERTRGGAVRAVRVEAGSTVTMWSTDPRPRAVDYVFASR